MEKSLSGEHLDKKNPAFIGEKQEMMISQIDNSQEVGSI